MKPASTVLAAYTVTPNTRPSSRSHSSWYTRPARPEAKKSSATVDSARRARGGGEGSFTRRGLYALTRPAGRVTLRGFMAVQPDLTRPGAREASAAVGPRRPRGARRLVLVGPAVALRGARPRAETARRHRRHAPARGGGEGGGAHGRAGPGPGCRSGASRATWCTRCSRRRTRSSSATRASTGTRSASRWRRTGRPAASRAAAAPSPSSSRRTCTSRRTRASCARRASWSSRTGWSRTSARCASSSCT